MENLKILRKRLLYQSHHRGMQEMDWLLGKFAQTHIESMGNTELQQFESLLAFSDQDLYQWFFEKAPAPQEAAPALIKALHAFLDLKCVEKAAEKEEQR